MSLLSQLTALPNLHPAVVHFPIVLLPTAIAIDLLGWLGKHSRSQKLSSAVAWASPAAVWFYGAAAVSALVTRLTGIRAADGLLGVPPELQPRIAQHSDWSLYTAMGLVAVALLALGAAALGGRRSLQRSLRGAAFFGAMATMGLLVRTADLGGALVYRHGIAVEARAPSDPAITERTPALPRDPPEGRIVRSEHGSIDWRPLSGDAEVLSTLVWFGARERLDVKEPDPASAPSPGLTLRFDSEDPIYLLLPDAVGDAEVRAWLSVTELEGYVGVVHHADSADSLGRFAVTSDGTLLLADLVAGKENILDRIEGRDEVPVALEIAVSASARHLKGLLGEETVAHGHANVLPGTQSGLVLQGRGELVLERLRVTPLDQR